LKPLLEAVSKHKRECYHEGMKTLNADDTATKRRILLSAAASLMGQKGGRTPTDKKKGFAAMPKWKRVAAGRKGGSAKTKGVVR
jgi:hypothetical protein